jgi:uncharacterized protein YggU (UPF0235/DUF167 family)
MYVKITALTGQKQEFLREENNERFVVSVKEKPEQNMANRKILEIIALHFKVPASRVKIVSGHHKPSKIFNIVDK